MSRSLMKKVLHILGSSAVALSLGASGASAFGKDIILPGSGILLFTGLATTGIVAAVKGGKKHGSKTALSNDTALSEAHCCTPESSTGVGVDVTARRCKLCNSKVEKPVYLLGSDGKWDCVWSCQKCAVKNNASILKELVEILKKECKCSSHLVRCALISLIEKDIRFSMDQLFEITKRACCVTSWGKELECGKKIEKSSFLGWLAGFSSKSNDESERAKELVMAIYNLDSKGFDDFYYQKVHAAKKS